jgi:WD40 repeat protein
MRFRNQVWRCRWPGLLAVLVGGVVVLLAGAIGSARGAFPGGQRLDRLYPRHLAGSDWLGRSLPDDTRLLCAGVFQRASAGIGVAILLALGAGAAGGRSALTATHLSQSVIAFVRYTPNGFGSDDLATLYLVHPDGRGLRRLTEPGPDGATEDRLSPDRSTVVFVGSTPNSWGCAVVSTKPGSKPRLYSKTCTSHPTWSADGKQLAFTLPERGIASGTLDGSNIRPVPHTNTVEPDSVLDWSPDGRTLVFEHVAPSRTFPPSAFRVSTSAWTGQVYARSQQTPPFRASPPTAS